MSKTIAIVATMDTKGEEVKYLEEKIRNMGKEILIIDSGTRGNPIGTKADITREMVAKAAGSSIKKIEKLSRGPAVELMQKGMAKVVKALYNSGKFDAIMSIGGSDGSLLASAGMQALPLGVPKFIVTPILQGNQVIGPYIGTSDIIMMHSVIDILGVNEISQKIFDLAIGAIIGMSDVSVSETLQNKNLIATTMYGNTTPAVMTAKKLLEKEGYTVVVFHPNGTGGKAMEKLINEGVFVAVLDMTTHEITDEIVGGLHTAGPQRLEAAGKKGIPQLVIPGCVDIILQGPLDSLPAKYSKRNIYYFNPAETLVRTNKEEMKTIGRVMAEKLNRATGPTMVMIPLGGFSMYSHKGEAMYNPQADRAFVQAIKKHLRPEIKIVEANAHINDPVFAETAASSLLEMMAR